MNYSIGFAAKIFPNQQNKIVYIEGHGQPRNRKLEKNRKYWMDVCCFFFGFQNHTVF